MFTHLRSTLATTLTTLGLILLASTAAPAATVVDTHSGGSVRVTVRTGPSAGTKVDKPALYRNTFNSYWTGGIDSPFCNALVSLMDKSGPSPDGNYLWAGGCRPSPDPGLLTMTYDDAAFGGDVTISSAQYFDVSGIYGPWPDRSQPRPRADGCFIIRFAVKETAIVHTSALGFDHIAWTVDGGYPQPGCANALNQYPKGDVSAANAHVFGSSGFTGTVGVALLNAKFDQAYPLRTARDAYAPTVRTLSGQFSVKTFYVKNGIIDYDFGLVSSRDVNGARPIVPPPTPNPPPANPR